MDPLESLAKDRAERLARAIVRCRELAAFLDASGPSLPSRGEAPFLYSQLDDVLKRLQASLRPLSTQAPQPAERPVGFLRRLAQKHLGESRARSDVRYDLEGNAWTIPVTELVGFLSHSGKSGLLWITTPGETFALEFARGSLVHATSNAPPASLRLGEILLREKMLEAEELTRLIEKAKAADAMLGSFLVHTGRLGHAELQRAMTIQVQQLFHRLMDAENALFRFQEGAQLVRSHGLEVNITQLLLESARQKDEHRQRADAAAAAGGEDSLVVLDLNEEGSAASVRTPPAPALPADAPTADPTVTPGSASLVGSSAKPARLSEPPAPSPGKSASP